MTDTSRLVFAMQIQFMGMTLYDCGVTSNPKHPESDPACTRVVNVQESLRLQVGTFPLRDAFSTTVVHVTFFHRTVGLHCVMLKGVCMLLILHLYCVLHCSEF